VRVALWLAWSVAELQDQVPGCGDAHWFDGKDKAGLLEVPLFASYDLFRAPYCLGGDDSEAAISMLAT
jgi:hypothetical protein